MKMTKQLFCVLFMVCIMQLRVIALGLPTGTNSDGSIHVDYEIKVLPANFFGPGSDPFWQTVPMNGQPIVTSPANALNGAETVIHRTAPANLPSCPSTALIPIEILALNLISVNPITVTYGTNPPEQWILQVHLSSQVPQPQGNYQVALNYADGGIFNATIPIIPKLIFTKVSSTQSIILDPPGGLPPLILQYSNRPWVTGCPQCSAITIPSGVTIDSNGDGIPDLPIAQSTNFFPGIASNGSCSSAGTNFVVTPAIAQDQNSATQIVFIPAFIANAIPTLSQWGLIAFGILIFLSGYFFIRRTA